jgi:hypothetical protein
VERMWRRDRLYAHGDRRTVIGAMVLSLLWLATTVGLAFLISPHVTSPLKVGAWIALCAMSSWGGTRMMVRGLAYRNGWIEGRRDAIETYARVGDGWVNDVRQADTAMFLGQPAAPKHLPLE